MTRLYVPRALPVVDPDTFEDEPLDDTSTAHFATRANGDEE